MTNGPIGQFMERHYRHFNASVVVDAAKGYQKVLDDGGKMMITLAGAMSTGEIGRSLAEMIRSDKVHIISCTGANLEEDIFNLVAHNHYKRVPNYRELAAEDEKKLLEAHYNRVTDTCIPEEQAMRQIERLLNDLWSKATSEGSRFLPHEYIYQLIESGRLAQHYEIDPKDSWVIAACEKGVPLVVPGWEDSTLGNIFAARSVEGEVSHSVVRSGIEYMTELIEWYTETTKRGSVGFFQIGGGIAGDFPICVVPLLHQDLRQKHIALWSYFCQISDSTTSYGSYSGAVPNEKISWGKLDIDTPKFIIESDASIVAPLIFGWLLGW